MVELFVSEEQQNVIDGLQCPAIHSLTEFYCALGPVPRGEDFEGPSS